MDLHQKKRKREREQEKQKRERDRLVQSNAESFPSQMSSPSIPPLFGTLKKSSGQSELTRMTKNILGPYDAGKEAIQSNLVQLLGTVEATPSTPLHATGNPFDRQFAKSLSSSFVTGTTNLAAAKTITSVASSSSSSVSVAQSRAELNRHSVAEPPNTTREEKSGGRSRVSHGRNDHSGSTAVKMNRQSSGSHSSTPKSTHKKVSSKTKDETSGEAGPRPTNMLVVKKPKDKGRVRPFKTPGSPTGNQQGATGLKKSATPSQGAVDLFKVENELSSIKSTPNTVTPHPRAPTPPVTSKKQQKLKKKHSHHLPTAAPTSSPATESQPILPSVSLSSTQKSISHSSSTSTLQPISSQQRHRKPSSSAPQFPLPTHSSSSHSTPIAKKQGSNLPPSQSHHHPTNIPPTSSDKERGKTSSIKSEPSQGGSAAPSLAQIGSSGAGFSEEKPMKRKKKKTKKEKGRVEESDKSKLRTVKEEPADKMECSVGSSDLIQHSQSSTTNNFYISSSSQQQMSSLGHSTLTSQPPTTSQVGSKITLESLSKQRPSNLSIDPYGEIMEESTLDNTDVQSLLKELMCTTVSNPITPLPTPKKHAPFTFPCPQQTTSHLTSLAQLKMETIAEAPPTGPAKQLEDSDSDSSGSSSESSSDSSDGEDDNEEGQEGGLLGSSMSLEEREDNITPGWEKVLPSIGGSITPLKTPPPITPQMLSLMNLPSTVISPLAPDTPVQKPNFSLPLSVSSASRGNSVSSFESLGGFVLAPNMQPQTVTGTVSSFGSLSGSHPIYSQAPLMATQAEVSGGVPLSVPTAISQDAAAQDAEMSSSSDESGSESDDEQSDSDEQSSAEEEEDKKALLKIPLKKDTAKLSTGSSVSSAPFFSGDDRFFFQGGNSGGFFGDDLISGLQGGAEEEAGNVPRDLGSEGHWLGQLQTLQPAREEKNSAFTAYTELDKDGDNTLESQQVATMPPQQEQPTTFPLVPTNSENLSGTLIPPVSSIDTPHETPALLTSLGPSSRPLSHQHSLDDSGRPGRKRKLERQSSLADNPTLRLQSLAQKTPRISSKRRRDSSLSSFSVSSVSSSDSSESSDEQSETEQPQPLASHSVLNPARSFPSSSTSSSSVPRQPPQDMVIQKALLVRNRSTSQLEAGELEDEEVEEEGEIVAEVKSLWVKIPLEKVDFQREQKPKAKVEPYNVTAPSKPPRRRSTIDSSIHENMPRLPGHHGDHDAHNMYSRPRERGDDHHGQYSRGDFHRDDRSRAHRGSPWDRESWRHGARVVRSRDRDRDHHRPRDWDDVYDESRPRSRNHPSNRNMSAEDCLREARKRKHDADKTRSPASEKAKAYLESVVYFMKHGDAIEREAQSWDGTQTKNPFRLYMDTIALVKYSQSLANDSKQIVALCLRCMSVLYWKLFLLKQTAARNIQKDLQDFFLPSKGAQKSPYFSSLSPIPSPASVGSTTSTGSGGGGASSLGSSQDPSPSSVVNVPKLIFNKAADHLTITSYLHQSMELWQQSTLIVEQYRDFFSNLDRRSGRITQFSPISVVADWLETGTRLIRYRS